MSEATDGYLSGEQLAPFKSADDGLCWWCGAVASSREHKFKRTDVTRMWGDSGVVWGNDERMVDVRSARKSSVLRFKPNLCAGCNNQRSQPFDRAYDLYAEYVWANLDRLWRQRHLDMRAIYGPNWEPAVLNLARYFAKHIACRMSSDGYKVPSEFCTFLDGASLLPKVDMALYKDPLLWEMHRKLRRAGIEGGGGLWIAPATGAVSVSRERLTMFSSSLSLGHIGVMYRWNEDANEVDPFYRYRKARLHRRDRLPTE